MSSCLVTIKGRKPVTVAADAADLDRYLFATTAEKVMVPTPSGKPTWLTVDKVLTVEPQR